MKIKAKDVRAGDRVVLSPGESPVDIDLVGPAGAFRGSCVLFAAGEASGMSIAVDAEIELLGRTGAATTPDVPTAPNRRARRRASDAAHCLTLKELPSAPAPARGKDRPDTSARIGGRDDSPHAIARRCLRPLMERPITAAQIAACDAVANVIETLSRERDVLQAILDNVEVVLDTWPESATAVGF
ncbi:conserved protein of unknown function [Rhodovastum atsumiense]|nr:conserved protein of unknown function [Rhodovastum atsumiense]